MTLVKPILVAVVGAVLKPSSSLFLQEQVRPRRGREPARRAPGQRWWASRFKAQRFIFGLFKFPFSRLGNLRHGKR